MRAFLRLCGFASRLAVATDRKLSGRGLRPPLEWPIPQSEGNGVRLFAGRRHKMLGGERKAMQGNSRI
jgi:hypothetical protein